MDKIINKFKQLLELADEKEIQTIYEAFEKILPEDKNKQNNTKVTLKVGWAVGNETEPGNHCNIIIKVDDLT